MMATSLEDSFSYKTHSLLMTAAVYSIPMQRLANAVLQEGFMRVKETLTSTGRSTPHLHQNYLDS